MELGLYFLIGAELSDIVSFFPLVFLTERKAAGTYNNLQTHIPITNNSRKMRHDRGRTDRFLGFLLFLPLGKRHVRKHDEQSGESVTDNVRQAVFQARVKHASIRDHLALHAGGLNSFDKVAIEVSTVARTHIVVPMDVSVLKGTDGKGKDGKGKDGEGKAKLKDDKDKADPKTTPNMDKKCFYCDKVGHVKSECRKKKKDDEERKTTLTQNSLASWPSQKPRRDWRTFQRTLRWQAPRLSDRSPSRLTSRTMTSTTR